MSRVAATMATSWSSSPTMFQQALGDLNGTVNISAGQLKPCQSQSHDESGSHAVVAIGVEALRHDQLAVCGSEVIEHVGSGAADVQ